MSHARRDRHSRNAWRLASLIFRPAGICSVQASGISSLHDQEFVLPDRNLVLVVDDDPGTLKGVQRLLRQHGYDSMLFPSVEAFENHRGIDKAVCVILDINLGDGSGIELRHRLKARGHSVPVIFMTADDDPAVRTAALASGCLAFLTKPFAAKSLIEPIAKASGALA
jgi:FixJ family two-component response regulator